MTYCREKQLFLRGIDPDLQYILKKTKSFIAGGAITSVFCNREIADYDIYVPSKKAVVAILAWCYGEEEFTYVSSSSYTAIVSSVTEKSITFNLNDKLFQIILFDWFETAEDIFNLFDFKVCMGAYSFEQDCFILHDDFLKDNSQRRLTFNPSTKYPLVSALRVDKYREKGYTISKSEFIRILLTCSTKDIQTWEELTSQMAGLYGEFEAKDIFPVDEDFSIGRAVEVLGSLEITNGGVKKTKDYDFESLVEKIHGDDPVVTRISPFREGYYYKRCNNDGSSCYDEKIIYKKGEFVNGGEVGVFFDPDPLKPFYTNRQTVVELSLTDHNEIVTSYNGKKSIKGDVKVERLFTHLTSDYSDVVNEYLLDERECIDDDNQ